MLYLEIRNSIYIRFYRFFFKGAFKKFGKKTSIIFPLKISGMKNISLGDNVHIAYKTWLSAIPIDKRKECILKIGNGTNIGNFNHIYATKSIIIGNRF